MDNKEKSALERLEDLFKQFWRKNSRHSVIAAKHTEFTIEPKVFVGDKLNPEILKLLTIRYLEQCSTQDSGVGNIEVAPDHLTIKSPKGKPLVIVRDKKVIQQYLNRRHAAHSPRF